ncbi:O-antigen ligase family protein [Bacillus sp. 1P06AnD]|uniref:O-antigen ligase family protein n=1 Tax=Bacillus sp. 1P06AnD TaxID=3132208 RepID=UPI0039A1B157
MNIVDKYTSDSSSRWQLFGFVGVLVLLVVALLAPSIITSALFLGILFLYSVIFPAKALSFLIIYFPARPFFIETNTHLKVMAEVIIFACLVNILVQNLRNVKSLFSFYWFEIAYLAFCAIGAISAFLNDVDPVAIVTQLRAFILTYLVFYITKRIILNKRDIKWYLWITLIVAFVLSILGIVEKISDKTWLFPVAWEGFAISPTNGDRVYGLTKNPNVLASFLAISFFTSFYLKGILPDWRKYAVWAAMIVIGTTAVLTYSRGTILSFAGAFVIYVVWKREWLKTVSIICTLAVAALLALGVVEPVTKAMDVRSTATVLPPGEMPEAPGEEDEGSSNAQLDRIRDSVSESTLGQSMAGGRLWVVKKGFEVYKDYPIYGSGFATFGDSASLGYGSPIYEKYDMRPGIYSDNQYIQVIAQTGTLGVIAFACFLIGLFIFLVKNRDIQGYSFVLLLFVAVVASSLLYNTWEDKTVTFFLFGMMGVFLSLNKQSQGYVFSERRTMIS